MTEIIDPVSDKILNTYRQYERLINGNSSVAAQLTVAHILDHVVCVTKENTQHPPKVVKINSALKKEKSIANS